MARPKPENPVVQVHLYLPGPLVDRLKAFARQEETSANKAAEQLITEALEMHAFESGHT